MNIRTRRGLLATAVLAGLTLAACGSSSKSAGTTAAPTTAASATTKAPDQGTATTAASTETTAAAATTAGGGKPVTITWWHIQNSDPGMTDWKAMADAYMKLHPNVKIEITVQENEAFKAALKTNMQSGKVPDLFQSWGGGGLRELVQAGLVKDITSDVADTIGTINPGGAGLYQVDGKQYGIPFNLGMVGFWYNKDLFAKAGITDTPTTWTALLDDVKKLKAANITPIAVGAGDKWPAHFWYSYLMLRLGGGDLMNAIAKDNDFNKPEVIQAGKMVQELVALEPFQSGFLGAAWDAPDGESGTMANGKAAMDLMGQWAPGAFRSQLGITDASKPLPWNIGWFPFPSVDGGKGKATDAFGGGDGFAVGKDAPPEAIDFLKFITNVDNQKTWGKDSGLPVTKGAEGAVADPNMQMVLKGIQSATFVQLYLDQFFSPTVGGAVNDAVQGLFAGQSTPEQAAAAITAAAKG